MSRHPEVEAADQKLKKLVRKSKMLSYQKAVKVVRKNRDFLIQNKGVDKIVALLDKAGYIYSNGKPLGECGEAQQFMSVYLMATY